MNKHQQFLGELDFYSSNELFSLGSLLGYCYNTCAAFMQNLGTYHIETEL
ncbi:MAG: hypothetical protein FWE97_03220 [Dehalococcoidia bacterium]|nr:hypothetical protein [Dehalococcoidia bacterium]